MNLLIKSTSLGAISILCASMSVYAAPRDSQRNVITSEPIQLAQRSHRGRGGMRRGGGPRGHAGPRMRGGVHKSYRSRGMRRSPGFRRQPNIYAPRGLQRRYYRSQRAYRFRHNRYGYPSLRYRGYRYRYPTYRYRGYGNRYRYRRYRYGNYYYGFRSYPYRFRYGRPYFNFYYGSYFRPNYRYYVQRCLARFGKKWYYGRTYYQGGPCNISAYGRHHRVYRYRLLKY